MKMKRFLFIMTLLSMLPLVCMAQDDDLYFTPSKKSKSNRTEQKAQQDNNRNRQTTMTIVAKDPTIEIYTPNARDDDEYNRRYIYGGTYQVSEEADSLQAEIEEVDADNAEMDNYEDDYYYSRRILRFRSPRVGIALSSPLYWDLVYDYGAYDYLYYDYVYDPFYWYYGWSYGWSWGPWSCWYGPIWGWHSPHHWYYWGCGPMWHAGIGHGPIRSSRYYNRGTFSNRYGGGERIRTSVFANGTRFSNGSSSRTRTSAFGNSTSGSRSFRLGDVTGSRSANGVTQNRQSGRTSRSTSSSYSDYTRSRSRGTTSSYSRPNNETRTTSNYTRPSSSRSSNSNASRQSTTTTLRSSSGSYSGSRSGGSRSGGSFSGGSRSGRR